MGDGRIAIGRRIKRLREHKGLSRQQVATHLGVDLTAVAAWEAGKYLPREGRRVRLAALVEMDVGTLFAEEQQPAPSNGAALVDTLSELPGVLRELLDNTEHKLRAFRISAPYATPAHVQEEFRRRVDARLLDGSIEVDRIEIFYDLARLKEVLANILRYQGRAYRVRTYCVGVKDVVPGMGGYMFDENEFLLGAYWAAIPPRSRAGLRLSGEPFRTYFSHYWSEIWDRGTELNPNGVADLGALRDTAVGMGLKPVEWPQFVEEARAFDVGDGLPPLI